MSVDDTFPRTSRPIPEVPTPYHKLLTDLAQDALEPFWTEMPFLPASAETLRSAARSAIGAYHAGNVDEDHLPEAFMAALPRSYAETSEAFLRRILWRNEKYEFGLWLDVLSQFQHKTHLPPMSPVATVEVNQSYRRDVVKKGNTIDSMLQEHLCGHTLSGWDMFLHATYGFCFEAHGEWPESKILLSLRFTLRNALFEAFLRRTVLTLPETEQHALGDVVRATWADLWTDDDDDYAPTDLPMMPFPDPSEAELIPDARALLG